MDDMLFYLMYIVSMFIFTIAHELGHVAMGHVLFGDKDWWIELGEGKPIISTKRFTVNLFFFMGGFAHLSKFSDERWRRIMMSAGGFTTNALCLALVFPLRALVMSPFDPYSPIIPYINDFFGAAFIVNVLLVILTAVPMKYPWNGIYSDGYRILWHIRNKKQ